LSFNILLFRHREELQSLQETDPDFFDYLQQHDRNLLGFGENDDNEEDDDDMDDDVEEDNIDDQSDQESVDDDQMSAEEDESKIVNRIQVNSALIQQTVTRATSGSITDLKKLLSMLRTACIPLDEDSEEAMTRKFVVPSASVYEEVIVQVISGAQIPS
jgi:nucleolar complex protein 2